MSPYLFRPGESPTADLVGGKGLGLIELHAMGAPVPPFAILTTELFRAWRRDGALPRDLDRDLDRAVESIERATGKKLGDEGEPLVLSVRSGAAHSMPGALLSVLDLGVREANLAALAERLGSEGAALDVLRRFLESWSRVVAGLDPRSIDQPSQARRPPGARPSVPPSARAAIDPAAMRAAVAKLFAALSASVPLAAPGDDVRAQLRSAVEGVLRSSLATSMTGGGREPAPTAIILQAMVFGNATGESGAGVALTRDPQSGRAGLGGEFLPWAQGSDVVGGRSSPAALTAQAAGRRAAESMESHAPAGFAALSALAPQLEQRFRDALEVELTVERGQLWLLQVRPLHASPRAAVKIAVDLAEAGLIDRATAVARIDPAALGSMREAVVEVPEGALPILRGLPASPGAASGRVVLEPEEAARATEPVILVRSDCSAEDIPGCRAAAGVLTAAGGLTSHAAVVARSLGKPCVVSASGLRIDRARRVAEILGRPLPASLTIDGTHGVVYEGALPVRARLASEEARRLVAWARDLPGTSGWSELE